MKRAESVNIQPLSDSDIIAKFGKIPKDLTSLNQWVLWKKDKVPYQVNYPDKKALSTNKNTWSSFKDAIKSVHNAKGIGLVITKGLIFIDFDHILDEECNYKPHAKWAEDLIDSLPETYAEISPSGDGLHLFFKGELPQHKNKKNMDNGTALEVYTKDRYSTFTGNVFCDCDVVEVSDKDIETIIHAIGAKDEDTEVNIEVSEETISKDEDKTIINNIELLDSDDMSSIDIKFFKDYIQSRRMTEKNYVPSVEHMQSVLKYKDMYELRKKVSSSNPNKYKRKDYINSTMEW